MDSQAFLLVTAAASLATGILLCWLVMRGRIAATQASLAAHEIAKFEQELTQAKERALSLDHERQLAVDSLEALQAQTDAQTAQHEMLQLARSEEAARADALQASLLALREEQTASQKEIARLSTQDADEEKAFKQMAAHLADEKDENDALKRDLAVLTAMLETPPPAPTAPLLQPTQLPVLETQVIALQGLAKTIEQEFLVLTEVQRNFTAASSALQDVS